MLQEQLSRNNRLIDYLMKRIKNRNRLPLDQSALLAEIALNAEDTQSNQLTSEKTLQPLKRQLLLHRQENKQLKDEVNRLKKSQSVAVYNQMEFKLVTKETECARLQSLLDELVKLKNIGFEEALEEKKERQKSKIKLTTMPSDSLPPNDQLKAKDLEIIALKKEVNQLEEAI